MGIKFTYNSELFERFLGIRENNTYEVIRFFEQYEHEMELMTFEERFIILCYYTNALFATAEPERHLLHVERLLQDSIIGDIQYVDGRDVFVHGLYQKVVSLLRLKRQDEAVRVAKQLVHIAPNDPRNFQLLRKSLLLRRPHWVRQCLGAAVLGMVIWTGLAVSRLMVFEPFFPTIDSVAEGIQYASLSITLITAVSATLGHYHFVQREVRLAQKDK